MAHWERADVERRADDPLLVLISHCRDMKRQETRLRLATLLLLVGCAAGVVFLNAASSAKASSVADPVFSTQKDLCPAGNPATDSATAPGATRRPTAGPLRIDLTLNSPNLTHGSVLQWSGDINGAYNSTGHAIVIPARGHYFVYMKFELVIREEASKDMNFFVRLYQWNQAYDMNLPIAVARESGLNGYRTVFVGQLFDLSKGDHLKVVVYDGPQLILKGSFGAFQT